MITEISIHDVQDLQIKAERLPSPAAEWTTVKISIKAVGVGGQLETQVINLFYCDTSDGVKFEDSEISRRIRAFSVLPGLTMDEFMEALDFDAPRL